MKVIFGIGNPGRRYELTKHNIGFIILDRLAYKLKLNFIPSKFDFIYAGDELNSFPFFLVKPSTYVNRSGQAADQLFANYYLNAEDFLVITDDINLPDGKIRIRKSGGDGGHNGLKSLIYHLQTNEFPRIRFGVGNNFNEGEIADYVLSPYSQEDLKRLEPNIDFAVSLAESFLTDGFEAMLDNFSKNSNKFNES